MTNKPDLLVENFFRHESANLISVLVQQFGFARFDVVEDAVQQALAEALRTWRLCGIPNQPAAWLHRVARNRIIDLLRREPYALICVKMRPGCAI